ncbi:MAG: MBOAT family protein [Bacteroidetes bacterium]|nr:MAG: MBOAT family protein [Bacteroidota bacterium]
MLFNSIDFAVFLPLVFIAYWFLTQHSLTDQNGLIVISSYIFYGWWDWRFLVLILFSTGVDYFVGRQLGRESVPLRRKALLWMSILANLGLFFFFKYSQFFIDNFVEAFRLFGNKLETSSLEIILPVGISFYTFQTLSYTIDVYRKKLEPTRDFIAFSAFVSFFPQLVAGPIERASNLLPQFHRKRTFEYTKAVDGMRQILWGLFKKMVIADNCAETANYIFEHSDQLGGSTLALGALFFAFQIYGDFSGYSDIAIGTSRLFGFDLKQNFAFPYFSRDIAEFWRRWHISLSTWFRDYLYIPLGGSREGRLISVRNTFIIFLVSGFWHGDNWTFILWGALHAIFFLPLLLLGKNRKNLDSIAHQKSIPGFGEFLGILSTFALVVLAWIFFRAENLGHAIQYFQGLFSSSLFSIPVFEGKGVALVTMILVLFLILIEWKGRSAKHGLEQLGLNWPRALRWSFYSMIVFLISLFMVTEETPFIYFQF